jgi:prepilin-type N-terminal cleavage/methylation domain-containing protein
MQSYTKKGFTILEILLVIALLAILFATVLYAFNPNKIITEVNDNKRQADALNLYQALEQYALKTGSYPANIQNTVNIPPGASLGICKTAAEQVGGSTNCSGKIDLRILVPDYISNIPSYSSEINDSGYYIVKDTKRKIGIGGFKGTDNSQFVQGLSKQTFDAFVIPDPYWSNVSLLLKFDENTIFTDSSNNGLMVTANGNTQISTTQSKWNTGSVYFDGNGDWLAIAASSALAMGTGDFTVEFWIYPEVTTDNDGLFSFTGSSGGIGNLFTSLYAGNLYAGSGGSGGAAKGSLSTNTWHHIALTRAGTSVKTFLNGTQLGSTETWSNDFNTNRLDIGLYYGTPYTFKGFINDFRVTKGVARYTANFTPPTQSFPNQ